MGREGMGPSQEQIVDFISAIREESSKPNG